MTESFTGRTRLRPAKDYGSDALVLQIEVSVRDDTGDPDATIWRDATLQDITVQSLDPRLLQGTVRGVLAGMLDG